MTKYNYGTAILAGFEYVLEKYPETFVIGQGLWSPWYVGNSMTGLDKKFGVDRIIDTPVSESACTGAAVGAALAGMKPIVVHPRMDFMLYAIDPIVNQAAKWSHMLGGQSSPGLTIRSIINRGGEQGAQHSQALHSWFAHIPGLRVVMPSSVVDARDLLIASVLSPDPVIYIDDRWLYSQEDELPPIKELNLADEQSAVITSKGKDVTVVGSGHASFIIRNAVDILKKENISVEVIDIRILNPFCVDSILSSVKKTKRILVVDSGTITGSFSGEVVSQVVENLDINCLLKPPMRLGLPDAPAPTSRILENNYYLKPEDIVSEIRKLISK